ncbi:DegV family protein [Neobacillus sp. D3-1R]|uniref:DegV family protein n=1 Tax=Neobacillus sp. D3-1R TaxID=3445778 RepID=UPI003FA03A3B
MKKKIAWITDSTAFITDELKNHPDVYVVPLGIIFGDQAFEDGIDLDTDELYQRIRSDKEIPKTSQPSSGRFAELFERLKGEYDHAISVHISSKLSGTLASCKAGAEMAQFPLEAIDSKFMSYAITFLLEKGIEMNEKGIEYSDIVKSLREIADHSENYILLGSLDQFYKGGRMSGTSYLLGSILKIKPIIRVNRNGEFELFEKVRSEKKAMARMIELLKESYDRNVISQIQIMHGNVENKAQELATEIRSIYPKLDIFIGDISSTIAVHAGEGTIGIIWNTK